MKKLSLKGRPLTSYQPVMRCTSGYIWPLRVLWPIPPSDWKMTNRSKSMIFGLKSQKMPIFRCTELWNYWTDFHELNVCTTVRTWTVFQSIFQVYSMSSSRVTVDFVTPTRAPREKLYISVLTDLIVIFLLEKEHILATAKLLTSYLTEKRLLAGIRVSLHCLRGAWLSLYFFVIFHTFFLFS